MINAPSQDFRIPRGVSDKLLTDTKRIKSIESKVLEIAESWGYQQVLAAPLEFEDVLALGAGSGLAEKSFRFDNWENGRMIAIPPDITPQMSRISATKLTHLPYPHRLSYSGIVLRHSAVESGLQREVIQAGVELIGASSPVADAEMLYMIIQIGNELGLQNLTINIGHVGVCKGVLSALKSHQADEPVLRTAISLKDKKFVQQYSEQNKLDQDITQQLVELTRLFGGADVLAKAQSLEWNDTTREALDELQQIVGALESYGANITQHLTFDLGDTRGLDYHTGITYECFGEKSCDALFTGGRYDTLMGKYGVEKAATGFTCNLGAVAYALDMLYGKIDSKAIQLLVLGKDAQLLNLCQQIRKSGISVVTVYESWTDAQAVEYARSHGVSFILKVDNSGEYILTHSCHLKEYSIGKTLPHQEISEIVNNC